MKNLILLSFLFISFTAAKAQSTSEDAFKDYQQAIAYADAHFPALKLKRSSYNLVKCENLWLYGRATKHEPSSWKITYKSKGDNKENPYMLKGGELFLQVDIKSRKVVLLGYSE